MWSIILLGIDLAFIENGFIYHTKYDTADRILTDSIQRAGWYSEFLMDLFQASNMPFCVGSDDCPKL